MFMKKHAFSTVFAPGSSLMKLAVKKDGHHFNTYVDQIVVDPAKPLPQPQDKETNGRKEDFKSKYADHTTDIKHKS